MANKIYIVGTIPMPKWVQRVLMPYRKLDGSTGYELYTSYRDVLLNTGDKLRINKNGAIRVSRCFDNVGKKKLERIGN